MIFMSAVRPFLSCTLVSAPAVFLFTLRGVDKRGPSTRILSVRVGFCCEQPLHLPGIDEGGRAHQCGETGLGEGRVRPYISDELFSGIAMNPTVSVRETVNFVFELL